MKVQLPWHIQGHWHGGEPNDLVIEYAAKTRADLAMSHLPDLALANAQFMVDRFSLELMGYQTAAKERIRWLSVQLAIATQPRKLTAEEIVAAISELETVSDLKAVADAVKDRVEGVSEELLAGVTAQ